MRKKRSFLDKIRDFFWQEVDEDGNPIKYKEEHEEDIKIYGNKDNLKDNLNEDNLDTNVHGEVTNKKNKLFIASVLIFVMFVLAFSGSLFVANWFGVERNSILDVFFAGEDEVKKILVMGIDEEPGGRGRADTIILAIINTTNPEVKLLSIPRDTRVEIPRRGNDKINHAHAHGGPGLLVETVNVFFDIEVEKYIKLNFNSFKEVVDILGGMELYVERRMFYPAEGIDLRPGMQILDGDKALQYVRFRGATGDIGRVERQQRFMMEFIAQKLELRYALRIPELAREINNNLETNLSVAEMVSVGMAMRSLEAEKIRMEMLPGEPRYIGGVSFWVSSTQDLDNIFPQAEDEEEVVGVDVGNLQ